MGDSKRFQADGASEGGDLIKWDKARIGYYVGIDIAEGSIEDCRRVIMVMQTITNAVKSSVSQPVCCVGIVLRLNWTGFLTRMPLSISVVASLLCITLEVKVISFDWDNANVIIKKLREVDGLEIGNSVYWIRFGEDNSQKMMILII